MAIYLVRHGQTDWNIEKRFQGQTDIPLNENGKQQAESCGRALACLRFGAVYASPLGRAVETAQILAAHTGGAPVTVEPAFIERSFGKIEGLTLPEGEAYLKAHPEGAGIESKEATGRRVVEALAQKAALHPGQDILVVSHGSAICCGLLLATGGQLAISGYDIPNGGINRLHCGPQGWKVDLFGVAPADFRPDLPEMPFPPPAKTLA